MKTNVLIRSVSMGAAMALCLMTSFNAAAADEQHGQLDKKDYKFLEEVSKANANEIALGQLAAEKSTLPAVKDYADKMVKAHTMSNEEVTKLISQKGATLPTEATAADTREMDHMKNLSGVDFDKAYVKHMSKDHKETVKEFEKAAKDAKDPDVKAFASKTLPMLQEHSATLDGVEQAVKAEKKAQ